MLIQTPERNWERIPASHPDHMAAGEAAIQAVYPDARNPFAHTSLLDDEGLDAWSVPEVWVMGHPTMTHYVDVTETFARKIAALRAHESQTAHLRGPRGLRPRLGHAHGRRGRLRRGPRGRGLLHRHPADLIPLQAPLWRSSRRARPRVGVPPTAATASLAVRGTQAEFTPRFANTRDCARSDPVPARISSNDGCSEIRG